MKYMAFIRRAVAWCLLAVTLFYMLTGFGISYSGIVGPLTLNLLGKAISFRIHDVLWAPFLVLLITHVAFRFIPKKR